MFSYQLAIYLLICSAIRMRINALKMRTQNRGSKVKVLKTLHLNHRVQLVIKEKKANIVIAIFKSQIWDIQNIASELNVYKLNQTKLCFFLNVKNALLVIINIYVIKQDIRIYFPYCRPKGWTEWADIFWGNPWVSRG